MKRVLFVLLMSLCLCLPALAGVPELARAISKAEGFKPGTKAWRNNNPGNIRRGPDYIHFKSKQEGWNALEDLLTRVADGRSRVYTTDMKLKDFGKRYAESRVWAKNVARVLNVTPETRMWEILDVPPKVVLPSTLNQEMFKSLGD